MATKKPNTNNEKQAKQSSTAENNISFGRVHGKNYVSQLAQPRRTNTTPQNTNKEGKTKGK